MKRDLRGWENEVADLPLPDDVIDSLPVSLFQLVGGSPDGNGNQL